MIDTEPALRVERGRLDGLEGPRIALVASWSATPNMSRSLSEYLTRLADYGYQSVVISTSQVEGPLQWPWGLPDQTVVVRRRNEGYDFGSWAAGINMIPGVSEAEHVLLTNDSLVGPFGSFEGLIRQTERAADVVFMTESDRPYRHGQSFFVMFNRGAINNPAVRKHFATVRQQRSKDAVIERYELPLMRVCEGAALSVHAVFSSKTLGFTYDNPTLSRWPQILFGGAPFLKRSVLLDPLFAQVSLQMQSAVVRHWKEEVATWLPEATVPQLPEWGTNGGDTNSQKIGGLPVQPSVASLGSDGKQHAVLYLQDADCLRLLEKQLAGLDQIGAVLLSHHLWETVVGQDRVDLQKILAEIRSATASSGESPSILIGTSPEGARGELPEWADGFAQEAPTGLVWPEPPLPTLVGADRGEAQPNQADAAASQQELQVDYPRLTAAALAAATAGQVVPAVYRPSEELGELMGFSLNDYDETGFASWLEQAQTVATENGNRGTVLIFNYAATTEEI